MTHRCPIERVSIGFVSMSSTSIWLTLGRGPGRHLPTPSYTRTFMGLTRRWAMVSRWSCSSIVLALFDTVHLKETGLSERQFCKSDVRFGSIVANHGRLQSVNTSQLVTSKIEDEPRRPAVTTPDLCARSSESPMVSWTYPRLKIEMWLSVSSAWIRTQMPVNEGNAIIQIDQMPLKRANRSRKPVRRADGAGSV